MRDGTPINPEHLALVRSFVRLAGSFEAAHAALDYLAQVQDRHGHNARLSAPSGAAGRRRRAASVCEQLGPHVLDRPSRLQCRGTRVAAAVVDQPRMRQPRLTQSSVRATRPACAGADACPPRQAAAGGSNQRVLLPQLQSEQAACGKPAPVDQPAGDLPGDRPGDRPARPRWHAEEETPLADPRVVGGGKIADIPFPAPKPSSRAACLICTNEERLAAERESNHALRYCPGCRKPLEERRAG